MHGVPEVSKSRVSGQMRSESEIALGHGLHRVFDEGAEKRVATVKARCFIETPLAVEGFKGGAETKVSRHVLLQLRPRPHKRNGAQVFKVDGPVLGT